MLIVFAYLWGFLVAILLPQLLLPVVQERLWDMVADHNNVPRHVARQDVVFLPAIVGLLERVLYVAAILGGQGAFIGVWLALKTAGGWKGWSGERTYSWEVEGQAKTGQIPGRQEFNLFLVGSALSLTFAAAAAYSIRWLLDGSVDYAVAATLTAVLLALATVSWRPSRRTR